jgi:hypothetical protein
MKNRVLSDFWAKFFFVDRFLAKLSAFCMMHSWTLAAHFVWFCMADFSSQKRCRSRFFRREKVFGGRGHPYKIIQNQTKCRTQKSPKKKLIVAKKKAENSEKFCRRILWFVFMFKLCIFRKLKKKKSFRQLFVKTILSKNDDFGSFLPLNRDDPGILMFF